MYRTTLTFGRFQYLLVNVLIYTSCSMVRYLQRRCPQFQSQSWIALQSRCMICIWTGVQLSIARPLYKVSRLSSDVHQFTPGEWKAIPSGSRLPDPVLAAVADPLNQIAAPPAARTQGRPRPTRSLSSRRILRIYCGETARARATPTGSTPENLQRTAQGLLHSPSRIK